VKAGGGAVFKCLYKHKFDIMMSSAVSPSSCLYFCLCVSESVCIYLVSHKQIKVVIQSKLQLNHLWQFDFMPLPPNNVGECIMFSGCLSTMFDYSFVRTHLSCYHDITWMAWAVSIKLTGNIHWPLPMTWLDFGDQRSKIKVKLAKASTSTLVCWGLLLVPLVICVLFNLKYSNTWFGQLSVQNCHLIYPVFRWMHLSLFYASM